MRIQSTDKSIGAISEFFVFMLDDADCLKQPSTTLEYYMRVFLRLLSPATVTLVYLSMRINCSLDNKIGYTKTSPIYPFLERGKTDDKFIGY